MFLVSPYSFPPGTMLSALQRLGLTSGLKLCLDAGDIDSYDGTSQVWTDTSGGGYNFNRGSGSGSDSADPTFNGTAGRQSGSEYFSFDGGDYLTLAQANPTWVNNLHKDGAKVSFAAWISCGFSSPLFGTTVNATIIGAGAIIGSTGKIGWNVTNGTSNAYVGGSTAVITADTWTFVALSLDEAANTASFVINGSAETSTGAYSSPTASNAPNTATIGKLPGVPDAFYPAGGKLANMAVWEGVVLTSANLTSIYTATKSKFGL